MRKSDRALLKNALGFISPKDHSSESLIAQILDRLAEPEDEPVAWLRKNGFRFVGDIEPQDDSELALYRRPSH